MYRLRFSIYVLTMLVFLGLSLQPTLAHADLLEVETNTPLRNVYVFEDKSTSDVRLEVFFMAGEADWDGPLGLSHYLEHLMYWHANKKVSGDDVHGRRGNAWVNGYITNYHSQAHKDLQDQVFDFALALLSPPDLDRNFMLEEREVVVREYELRYQENPDARGYDQIQIQLLENNPAGRSVMGDPASIMSLTVDDAMRFHSDYYHPANMVLLLVGDISSDEVKAEVEKRFSGLDAGKKNDQSWRGKAIEKADRFEVRFQDQYVAFDALQAQFVTGWTLGRDKIEDYYVQEIADRYLNSAVSGSPAKGLRIDEFVFSTYEFWINPVLDGQTVVAFEGRLDKGVDHKAAKEALDKELSRISGEGISQASLERLKKRMMKEAVRRADERGFNLDRAARLLSAGIAPNNAAENLQRLEAVTKEQVDSFLSAIGTPTRRADILFMPEKQQ